VRNFALSENLMYRIPLESTMRMILNFYWKPPKTILDVTAGERKIWDASINQIGIDGFAAWKVDFSDKSKDAKADIIADCRNLPVRDFSYDIIVFDPPFTEVSNGSVEGFGLREGGDFKGRAFYMREFEDIKELCEAAAPEFNRIAREGLVVKMGDRHDERRLIAQHIDAYLAFSKYFECIDIVHYRGNRPVQGARLPFTANTVTYYLVFKKNVYRS
jgi:hypothetical protein